MKPLYLAGPMTGYPQFNFPAFERAAKLLREAGHVVSSPHENDTPEVQAAAWASPDGKLDANGMVGGKTWGDILSLDVKHVADDCSGVVLIDGWSRSRGARLEAFVATLCDLPVYALVEPVDADPLLVPMPKHFLGRWIANGHTN